MARVLVVDDTSVDRRLVEELLRKGGFETETASHGLEALAALERDSFDLVVTDLQMPELDGLELVAAVRDRFPQVPIVLTTAFGSEDLAAQALERGAASYVPKGQLASRLSVTVDHVLRMSRVDEGFARLSRCVDSAELTFTLENDADLVDRLVELLQGIASTTRVGDVEDPLRLAGALEGALLTAMLCGNLELTAEQLQAWETQDAAVLALVDCRADEDPYAGRKLSVKARLAPGDWRFEIRHEGRDLASHFHAERSASEMQNPGQRGWTLMRLFMDEVQLEDGGRTLKIKKRGG